MEMAAAVKMWLTSPADTYFKESEQRSGAVAQVWRALTPSLYSHTGAPAPHIDFFIYKSEQKTRLDRGRWIGVLGRRQAARQAQRPRGGSKTSLVKMAIVAGVKGAGSRVAEHNGGSEGQRYIMQGLRWQSSSGVRGGVVSCRTSKLRNICSNCLL